MRYPYEELIDLYIVCNIRTLDGMLFFCCLSFIFLIRLGLLL
jgi:hypothetical protein